MQPPTLFQFQQCCRAAFYASGAVLFVVLAFTAVSYRTAGEELRKTSQLLNERLSAVTPEQVSQIAKDAASTTAKGHVFFDKQLELLGSTKNQKALEAGWQTPAIANGTLRLINTQTIPAINDAVRELTLQTSLTGLAAKNTLDGVAALTAVLGSGSEQVFAKVNRLLDSPDLLELLPRVKTVLESTTATVEETRAIAAELTRAAQKSPAIAKETEQVLIDAQNFLRAHSALAREGKSTLDTVKKATWINVLFSLAKLFF